MQLNADRLFRGFSRFVWKLIAEVCWLEPRSRPLCLDAEGLECQKDASNPQELLSKSNTPRV